MTFSENSSSLEGDQTLRWFSGYFDELLKVKPPARVIHTSQLIALSLGYFINFKSQAYIQPRFPN